MYRGTTPILYFELPFDVTKITKLYLTFQQGSRTVLEKELEDCTLRTGNIVEVHLSQADTLIFAQNAKYVDVQFRVLINDVDAMASDPISLCVKDIFKEGEI